MRSWGECMGWMGEIDTLEELEALMCGNVLPKEKPPEVILELFRVKNRLLCYLSMIEKHIIGG